MKAQITNKELTLIYESPEEQAQIKQWIIDNSGKIIIPKDREQLAYTVFDTRISVVIVGEVKEEEK